MPRKRAKRAKPQGPSSGKPTLRGRELAMTRGKGRKVGLHKQLGEPAPLPPGQRKKSGVSLGRGFTLGRGGGLGTKPGSEPSSFVAGGSSPSAMGAGRSKPRLGFKAFEEGSGKEREAVRRHARKLRKAKPGRAAKRARKLTRRYNQQVESGENIGTNTFALRRAEIRALLGKKKKKRGV